MAGICQLSYREIESSDIAEALTSRRYIPDTDKARPWIRSTCLRFRVSKLYDVPSASFILCCRHHTSKEMRASERRHRDTLSLRSRT